MAISPTRVPRRTETVHISIPADIRAPLSEDDGGKEQLKGKQGDSRALRQMGRRNRAYRQLLGSLYDAILVTASDGRVVDVNDRAVQLLGYSRSELSGMHVTCFIDGADESLLEGLRDSILGGAFTVLEAWCLRQDGSDFAAEIAAHSISLTDEAQICFMVRDISRRIEIERDVTRLSKAVASTSDAVTIFDAEGEPVYHNPAYEQLLAVDRSETLHLRELLPDDELRETVTEAVARGEGWRGEIEVRGQGGSPTPVLFRADAIEIGDESAGAVAIMTDITQRKQDERRLRETLSELEASNADLAQFAYVASHDLKEPLRGISGYLQLMERRWGDQLESDALQYLRNAVQGAERMKEMINQILTYSRLNREAGPIEPVDSAAILAQATANLGHLIQERSAKIHVADLPPVKAPPARLQQVFQNLVANALKFCEGTPEIWVSATASDEEVVFRVRDNGIGIKPELVDRAFMLFQRLHTQSEYEGTGIGLATCRKLVEQWGGKIVVESSTPGEGAVFAFSVPTGDSA